MSDVKVNKLITIDHLRNATREYHKLVIEPRILNNVFAADDMDSLYDEYFDSNDEIANIADEIKKELAELEDDDWLEERLMMPPDEEEDEDEAEGSSDEWVDSSGEIEEDNSGELVDEGEDSSGELEDEETDM